MSKLDELIKKLCPNGVKFVELSNKDLFKFYYGKGNKIPEDVGGIYNVYGANGIVSHINEYNCEDITIIGHIGAVGMINRCKEKCFVTYNGTIAEVVDKSKVNTQYFYYVLTTLNLPSYKKGSQPFLSFSDFKNIKIPVPPIEVQNKIVRILDNFTELESELESELEVRKEQYNYYFYKLMNSNQYKKIKLSEIGKVKMCKRILKNQTTSEGDIPFYKIGTFGKKADAYISEETFKELKTKYSYPKKGDILISCSGTIGRTVVFDGKPAYFQDSNIVWLEHDETIITNSFLKYCYRMSPWKIATGGTIARLYNDNILNAEVLVPPLKEQQRIVSILDRFDKLCNDISEGLPAEIEARRKQYEYYRDKLLNFKEIDKNE